MVIAGFQKLTLIDYPGKLATTVFTVGCSFRCPFCHNPELVLGSQFPIHNNKEKEFFKFLRSRKSKLDGVCITGGEPTIQLDIIDFIKKIKKMGFAVKLDTNGTRPDVLRKIIQGKLVDFIAMDIKNHPGKYDKTTATKGDIARIKLSVELIKNSGLDYEFRTTVVPGLHVEKDFEKIAKWLKGAKSYWLQRYRQSKILDPTLPKKVIKDKTLNLEQILENLTPHFEKVGIRE
ncbi:MAG TPA: anaerobic ribonucleoside-triphosphate reductase activating protein [Patescibacteria group bacterium]|nr:anaerobic ribonucleoside-triphosphate reductase activating protein [Patescibacteria group bacterium]